ncbi:MAG: RsmE family RNA methyltransferase [Geminicoccaceae bacterium]|nr:RsmE family RNA methyltransferase [Geminicoccaceae bacterium]
MASLPRLFVDAPLPDEGRSALSREQVHYVTTVMRRRPGDEVLLFNGKDGEWRARIADAARREIRLQIVEHTRPQTPEPGPRLWFAPLKRARQDLLLEKATELGVARLSPVLMRRSVVEKVNLARQRAILIEAAEQSRRLTIPVLDPPVGLDPVIAAARDHPILWADEADSSPTSPAGGPLTPSLSPEGRGSGSSPGHTLPLLLEGQSVARPEFTAGHPATHARYQDAASLKRAHHPPHPWGVRDGVRGKQDQDLPVPLLDAFRDHGAADLLIGPEGGFDPEERVRLVDALGIVRVGLGPRILRAETAALVALVAWQLARRD